MEVGQQVTEAGERAERMSAPHDVPIRHSAPPLSTPTLEGSHQSPYSSNAKDAPRGSDVWAGAISRLQVQVQLNTSMLEQNRQKFLELENSMQVLHHDMNGIRNSLHEVHVELRARPNNVESRRQDPRDLEVLVQQVEAVTNKANEVDGLRLQLDLLRNTLKRMEEHGSPAVSGRRPTTSSTHRDTSFHDLAPHPPPVSHHPSNPPLHQPLPPMRTASMSSTEIRPTSLSAQRSGIHGSPLEHQGGQGYYGSPYPVDPSAAARPTSTSAFRPPEPLPPPSSLTGWRPADSMVPPGNLPPPPPPPGSVQRQSMEPTAGWAAVNAAQTSKRPYEEHRPSPHESPASGSPKRPKLAPIMPRSNYGDESSYVPSSFTHSHATESPFTSRSRAPSDGSQSQILPTPASANPPGHRFIISTQDADSQASWRPDGDRMMHAQHLGHGRGHGHGPHPHGHGRGRGRGLRGRGRRGRGGGGGVGVGTSHPPEAQELGTPEWERPGWSGSQVSPNGFHNPMQQQHQHPPDENARDRLASNAGSAASVSGDREGEFPATPLAVQGPYDPFTAGHPDSAAQTSGGKKTRTKPIRNAEGVLIRKDGRPDMRSVSSANNLRKVHAKKEAERAEVEGRTPTSGRSLAPAGSNPMSEDENASGSPGSPDEAEDDGEEQYKKDRHNKLLSYIFSHETDSAGRSAGERFFPRAEEQDALQGQTASGEGSEEPGTGETEDTKREAGSQVTDVVMKEMSEAQSEDHAERVDEEDTKMPTVDEINEEQEEEGEKEKET